MRHWLLIMSIMSGLVVGCGTPLEPPRPNDDSGEPGVKELFEEQLTILEADRGNPEHWHKLAMAYHANQQIPLAIICYQQAIEAGLDTSQVHLMLGLANAELAQDEAALAAFRKAVEVDPSDAEAKWRLALALLELGQAEQALQRLSSGTHDAGVVAVQHIRAQILIQLKRESEAINGLRAWLTRKPGDLHAHYLLGVALRNQGKSETATPHLKAGVGTSPDRSGVQVVIQEWARDTQSLRTKALRDLDNGSVDRAISQLKQLADDHPEDATLVLNLGMATVASGDMDSGKRYLEQSLDMNPELELAHRQLAGIELRGKNADAARKNPQAIEAGIQHLRKAIAISPENSSTQSLLGKALVLQGKNSEAIEFLLPSAQARPGDTQLTVNTISLLLDLERYQEALDLIEVLRVIRPDDPNPVISAATAYAGLGDMDLARSLLQMAGNRWPRHQGIKRAMRTLEDTR